MRMKSIGIGVLVVIVLSLVAGAGSVFAAGATGSGPDTAGAVPAAWQQLGVGQRVWYAFSYSGDGSQIAITLAANPTGSATFAVWTPGDLKSWQATGNETPVGRGTDDGYLSGDTHWSGNFNESGTYYVVVDQSGSVPASYQLTVNGSGVSYPAAPAASGATSKMTAATTSDSEAEELAQSEAAAAQASAPASPAVTSTAKVAQASAGTSPENAIQAQGTDKGKLQPGEVRWYAFQAAGGNSSILVRLSDPNSAATFSVWTPAEIRQWQDTGVENPVGRGSANSDYNNDQVWAGSFLDGGTYFIRVEQTGSTPADYQFQIIQ